LDLVQLTFADNLPICKILDYNKYVFDQKNKVKKTKVKKQVLKEVKLKPNIAEGDMNNKIARARKFIQEGNSVKFNLMFRGREMKYTDVGIKKLKIVESELLDIAKVERDISMKGNKMMIVFIPK